MILGNVTLNEKILSKEFKFNSIFLLDNISLFARSLINCLRHLIMLLDSMPPEKAKKWGDYKAHFQQLLRK